MHEIFLLTARGLAVIDILLLCVSTTIIMVFRDTFDKNERVFMLIMAILFLPALTGILLNG